MTTASNTARNQYGADSNSATLTDVKRDAMTLKDDAASYLAGTASAGVDVLKRGAESVAEKGKTVVAKGDKAMQSACDYIGERPIMSILIAVGVGALIGRLFHKR